MTNKRKVIRAWAVINKDEGFYYCDISNRNLMLFKERKDAVKVRDLWAPKHKVIQVEIRPIKPLEKYRQVRDETKAAIIELVKQKVIGDGKSLCLDRAETLKNLEGM